MDGHTRPRNRAALVDAAAWMPWPRQAQAALLDAGIATVVLELDPRDDRPKIQVRIKTTLKPLQENTPCAEPVAPHCTHAPSPRARTLARARVALAAFASRWLPSWRICFGAILKH